MSPVVIQSSRHIRVVLGAHSNLVVTDRSIESSNVSLAMGDAWAAVVEWFLGKPMPVSVPRRVRDLFPERPVNLRAVVDRFVENLDLISPGWQALAERPRH